MVRHVWPALLALPLAALLGAWCAALAGAYARLVMRGAAADEATLLAAARLACRAGCRWVGRRCRPRARHPVVLGAALLAFACLPWALRPSALDAARFAACAVLLALAFIDARCGLLPDALTLPLLWAGLLLAWAGLGVSLPDALIAAAAAYMLLRGLDAGFAALRGRAGLGGGDMKLAAALGAWLGWAPLPGLLLAACAGGIAYALLARGGGAWRASLAFGPFLAAAGALGLAGGPVVQFLF